MQRVFAARLGLLLGLSAVAVSARAADEAAAIVHTAAAYMSAGKSYQGLWETTNSMGQMGSMTLNMDMKMVPASGKAYMKVTPTGQATGMMAMGAAMANATIVDDGKNMYMYMQAVNGYFKQPHGAAQGGQFRSPLQVLNQKGATYKLIGTEKVGRSVCSVIQVSPPENAQLKARGMTMKTTVYIDKATNRLKQIKEVTTIPAAMMGAAGGGNGQAGGAPQQVTTTMVPKSEKLNENIPESTFKFTPPAGVQEIKGGMAGMMGGLRGNGRPPSPK